MTKKWSVFLAGLAVLSVLPETVDAADYQVQVGGAYARVSPDNNFQPDIHIWSVYGTYYLAPVRTRSHPLAEAAFLERVSSISAMYGQVDYGTDTTDSLLFAGDFYLDRLLLGGQITRISNGDNDTDWSATIGYAPVDGALLTVAYSDAGNGAWHIDGKLIRPLREDRALGLQAGVGIYEHMNWYSVAVDYYLDRTLSLGGGVAISDLDRDGSGTEYTVAARKFFTPAVSAGVHYTMGDWHDAWGISGAIRF